MSLMEAIRTQKADLILRLSQGAEELKACQRLRYKVFYEELAAKPDEAALATRMDADQYDPICDHLVVIHAGAKPGADSIMLADGELVGTYRLLPQDRALKHGGFYTQQEYDVMPVIKRHPSLRFLELGRSCVLQPYRTKPVIELLWQGIWNYVRALDLDVMFGCASLEGTDPEAHAEALTFLAEKYAAPAEWHVKAQPHRYVEMRRRNPDSVNLKAALRSLPPLIKGYLRLGCYIGDGAVIDLQFNTVDVLIVLPVSAIDTRYFAHFGRPND